MANKLGKILLAGAAIGSAVGTTVYLMKKKKPVEQTCECEDEDYDYFEKTAEEAKAEEDAKAAAAAVVENEDKHVYGEPDAFVPFKEELVSIDYFEKLDLRVCEIVNAQEIRKSHSCLKLTLNDGSDKPRVIVSSIKSEYTCEQLVGKKIIVIANLEPARLTGVESQGMLLAATNGACGCQVVFLPDCVPAGTQIK